MNKSQLGFKCGETCAVCGSPLSLDGQGRYTCFSCGCFSQAQSGSQPGGLKLRRLKTGQAEFFVEESAIMKMVRGQG